MAEGVLNMALERGSALCVGLIDSFLFFSATDYVQRENE